jgi:hypothetical protein
MKLIVPADVSSISFEGKDVPITDGTIDVEGAAFDQFHASHGFVTEDEQAATDAEAGKQAAIAAAVVQSSKKK